MSGIINVYVEENENNETMWRIIPAYTEDATKIEKESVLGFSEIMTAVLDYHLDKLKK